jgi:hypothetical protein
VFIFNGWTINQPGADVKEMEQAAPGSLYSNETDSFTAHEHIREDGRKIQKEQMESLEDFREDFLGPNLEKENE